MTTSRSSGTTLAASYAALPWLRAGLEVAGEVLEGFVERDEAEGGAKLLFGPSVAFALPAGFFARLFAAAVTTHAPGAAGPTTTWGAMGRVALVWSWR